MANKTRFKPRVVVISAFALAVAACGGAANNEPAMAPSSSGAPATETDVQSSGAAPVQPSPSPESAPPSAGASSDTNASSRDAELRGARREVQLATRDLDSSMGDCANVCRALMSLERATTHLCALAAGDSDRSTCDDAKTRVQRAQAQIKASCGTCANGASLDSK